ncbi:DUF4367 domain-containing protein [Desulfitobacterium sp.]|uniref:DUF4367 domain-containing protein n=1 Tax=Desulfitobacterium sp. TaxID=49981 RepID=UPI002B20F6B3|nr:DUF4367 domain-containing protein [Desulfitobacterium sp.]MEA4901653.1 DUF4367 domain-containing protein [Desulfitobacterium sp.]
MPIPKNELDELIKEKITLELKSQIELPNVDEQWEKIEDELGKENIIYQRKYSNIFRKRIAWVAVIFLIAGSISLIKPTISNAFGEKIVGFFNYIVGQTTQNKTEIYKQPDETGVPQVKNLGSAISKEVTLSQAKTIVPFKLAEPSYLPLETKIRKVTVTNLGADIYQVDIEYEFKNKVIIFNQQNSSNASSRGSLYDTDDTSVKNLLINGNPAMLFKSKNNICTLNWQSRGILLQITGELEEDEIIKIANSIQ